MADQNSEVLQQIQTAWKDAQRQLETLRAAVSQTEALAKAQAALEDAARAKDRALRALGEAAWMQVQAGALSLPAELTALVDAVSRAERSQAAQASDIRDLLAEGAREAARKNPTSDAKSGLALRGNKR